MPTADEIERRFFEPPRFARPAAEIETLSGGRRFEISYREQKLAAWSFGWRESREGVGSDEAQPRSIIVLQHGWGGRGGQLHAWVPALQQRGFAVILYDALAHGDSPGTETNMVEISEALQAVVAYAGSVRGVIAHSIGAASTALAMKREASIERAVFLAPPYFPDSFTGRLVKELNLNVADTRALRDRLEARHAVNWDELALSGFASTLRYPLIVFHDPLDRDVPYRDSQVLANTWPGATLVTTERLGHRKIISDAAVIQRGCDFLR